MNDYDAPVSERIDRLHEQAEELADRAKYVDEPTASAMRANARALIRQAARLRNRYDEENA